MRAQNPAQQPGDRAGPHHRTTAAALRTAASSGAERDTFGDGYHESGYVFTDLNGDPVSPGWLTHQFQRLIAEQDMPPIQLHDLRHSAATLALTTGVQEMLGHSSIVLTADTYTFRPGQRSGRWDRAPTGRQVRKRYAVCPFPVADLMSGAKALSRVRSR
ncbi:tyrosine-type recombinase/integrase [Actinomadura rubrisoli]|uniref:tyrosine-type recombinase/integrase n=1 Tax=Actinomadura rubrisoli TaxID=2530368 RepID=UPI001A9F426F|nr:tyrosine-type recombinase/integrase [Actinomadura rubrisoli]